MKKTIILAVALLTGCGPSDPTADDQPTVPTGAADSTTLPTIPSIDDLADSGILVADIGNVLREQERSIVTAIDTYLDELERDQAGAYLTLEATTATIMDEAAASLPSDLGDSSAPLAEAYAVFVAAHTERRAVAAGNAELLATDPDLLGERRALTAETQDSLVAGCLDLEALVQDFEPGPFWCLGAPRDGELDRGVPGGAPLTFTANPEWCERIERFIELDPEAGLETTLPELEAILEVSPPEAQVLTADIIEQERARLEVGEGPDLTAAYNDLILNAFPACADIRPIEPA